MTAPKTLARTAGLLYLIVAAGGLFAVPVFDRIVESGDAAATADIDVLIGAVGGLSELALVAWLLVKGVRGTASKLPVPA